MNRDDSCLVGDICESFGGRDLCRTDCEILFLNSKSKCHGKLCGIDREFSF